MDFSWRSLIGVVLALVVPVMGVGFYESQQVTIGEMLLVAAGTTVMAVLLYGALAPFVAMMVMAVHEYRKTHSIMRALAWPVGFLVMLLLITAVFFVLPHYLLAPIRDWVKSSTVGSFIWSTLSFLLFVGILISMYESLKRHYLLNLFKPSKRRDVVEKTHQ